MTGTIIVVCCTRTYSAMIIIKYNEQFLNILKFLVSYRKNTNIDCVNVSKTWTLKFYQNQKIGWTFLSNQTVQSFLFTKKVDYRLEFLNEMRHSC